MIEVVKELPVRSLSHSAIATYLKCPEQFRRKYIENEMYPRSPSMVLGSACGGAFDVNWKQKVTSRADMAVEDVLDAYADSWGEACEESEVQWESERSTAQTKDKGAIVVANYVTKMAPRVQPVASERRIDMHWPGADWSFGGILDVETERGVIIDTKVKSKAMSLADADGDLQPTAYTMLRQSEGNPAKGFEFHVNTVLKEGPVVTAVEASRSDAQVKVYQRRVLGIAKEIRWRAENEEWQGAAPGAWWCSSRWCGFYYTCPMGGGA